MLQPMTPAQVARLYDLEWRKMTDHERMGYAGVEGTAYIAEDDLWQFVLDVTKNGTMVQGFDYRYSDVDVQGVQVDWTGLWPEFNVFAHTQVMRLNCLRRVELPHACVMCAYCNAPRIDKEA